MATVKIVTHEHKKPTVVVEGRTAPTDARYIAQDASGHWFWYSKKPRCGTSVKFWFPQRAASGHTDFSYAGEGEINNDWRLRCYRLPANRGNV